jgi:hypothetical protein
VVFRESTPRLEITLDAMDVFSSSAHARRSRLLLQMAFGPNVRVGVLAARPSGFDPDAWWRTSSGVQSIIFQSLGYAWLKMLLLAWIAGFPE